MACTDYMLYNLCFKTLCSFQNLFMRLGRLEIFISPTCDQLTTLGGQRALFTILLPLKILLQKSIRQSKMTYSLKPLNLGEADRSGRRVVVSLLRHNDRRMAQSDRSTPRLCGGRVMGKVATPLGTSRHHRMPVEDQHTIDAVWQTKEDVRVALKDTLVWKWKSYLKKRSRLVSLALTLYS